MRSKFYTIFILPHARARFRQLHLSRRFALSVLMILAVVALAGALSPHLLFKVVSQSESLARLKAENLRLRQEKLQFEASLAKIGAQLSAFEGLAGRLARAVGLEEGIGRPRPAGGSSPPNATRANAQVLLDEELDALRSRADSLDGSLASVSRAWEERLRVLSSTPSLVPVDGRFSDGFGWRNDPFDGNLEFHKGLDIVAPVGTAVRATADGLVTTTGRVAGYGKTIHLSHGFGFATRYGHLSNILVKPGQRVRRGDVIARVGSTGRSTGPHLHYEVVRAGRSVDPRRYLLASRH